MLRNPLTDAIVVLIVVLLFFGPKRLPMLSRSLGESFREFRGGLGSRSSDDEEKPRLQSENSDSDAAPAKAPSEPASQTPSSGPASEAAPVPADRES